MELPRYSLAERDRRWALARELMAAEEVEALIAYGGWARDGERHGLTAPQISDISFNVN
jgi:hypothetical protein